MCLQIIENKDKEMGLQKALVYLQTVKKLTHDNEIVWKEWSDYQNGIENYFYQDGENQYYALLTLESSTLGEKFQMYVEDDEGNWYIFDDRYAPILSNIYNWMTVEYDPNDSVIDAEYEVVNDDKPFEFVMNANYNFEMLG